MGEQTSDQVAQHVEGPGSSRRTLPTAPFAEAIGRTRYVVLVAVAAVLLVAIALFVFGAGLAVASVWTSLLTAWRGEMRATDLSVEFLQVVGIMLKAVVFFLVGVGLYSLFISPLNLTTALGVDTINDLESKIVSVIVVIMSVTFLEHFIVWERPYETLAFGGTLALVVAALVLFQVHSHRVRVEQRKHAQDLQERAQRHMFERGQERQDIGARPNRVGPRFRA